MSALFIEAGLRGSVIIAAAAAIVVLLSRASAATRHAIWTLVVVGLLLLPVFAAVLPPWEIAVPLPQPPIEVVAQLTPDDDLREHAGPADAVALPIAPASRSGLPAGLSSVTVLLGAYAIGAVLLLARLFRQRQIATRVAREARPVTDAAWQRLLDDCIVRIGITRPVALRRSAEELMPATIGVLSPTIVIPAIADTWPDDRRRAVLLHELAHIARHDCLTQTLAAVACAVYWFHPGVWYVARRLRIEREVACDDRVLATGTPARDYAGHLLELSYGWSGRRAPALSVSMAGSRKLEGRMLAVLDAARNRAMPTRRAWLAGSAVAAALLVPVAVVTTQTTSAPGDSDITSSASDDSGSASENSQQRGDNTAAPAQVPLGSDETSGTWELTPGRNGIEVRIRMSGIDGVASYRNLEGDIEAATGQRLANMTGPVRLSIRREAGTFEIEGTMRSRAGTGTFRFVPSQSFVAGLTARGFASPRNADLMSLAAHDVGFVFIDELAAQKYITPDLSQVVRAVNHGVRLEYLREMGQLGYRVGVLETLIRMRDHGVTPDYISELKALGYTQLSVDGLIRARDHGVTADFVRGLQPLGSQFSMDDLIRARDHGVTPDYLTAIRGFGYTQASLDEVIRARDHGVTPEYIGEMRKLGHQLALPELIRARDHGVTPDYVAGLAAQGYVRVPIDSLIRLRDHGVTPDFVSEIKKHTPNPSVEDLIRLRDRADANGGHLKQLVAYLRTTHVGRAVEQLVHEWGQ